MVLLGKKYDQFITAVYFSTFPYNSIGCYDLLLESLLPGGTNDDDGIEPEIKEAVNSHDVINVGIEMIDDFWKEDLNKVKEVSGYLRRDLEEEIDVINA